MLEVIFTESEAGIDPYKSRLLLGNFILRMDDGSDDADFVFFDLRNGDIHSFNHEDRTHLRVQAGPAEEVDFEIHLTEKKTALEDAPQIGGTLPIEHQYLVDGERCRVSVNVSGMLPVLTRVLQRYEQNVMADARTRLGQLPASIKTGCYMANNYLYADAYLEQGFPLRVSDYDGRQRHLISHRQVNRNPNLLSFPQDYRLYRPLPGN